jgi:NAD(P)-dependent dehydrogenase (short-subunit alcohol dehydrogenase family)
VSFEGKTVVITGAAGKGMGRALVRLFAAEGARVVAADVDAVGLAALVDELPDVVTVQADTGVARDADRLLSAAGDRVDVLCNHAGISERIGLVEEADEDAFERVLQVNLVGPFRLCRRVLPRMVASGGGAIVNTASVNGLRGGRGGPAYTASKFGLVGLTQHIAATYARQGIRCNAVCPGPMGDRPPSQDISEMATERGLEMLARDREKPAPCPPEQVAAMVLFLASDAAVRVNGAIIPVDGGWIAY